MEKKSETETYGKR